MSCIKTKKSSGQNKVFQIFHLYHLFFSFIRIEKYFEIGLQNMYCHFKNCKIDQKPEDIRLDMSDQCNLST